MKERKTRYSIKEEIVINYLKLFRGQSGLYIIRAKKGKSEILKNICQFNGFKYKSDVAYVGKGQCLKTTDLYNRTKQELGWSNFVGATFMKKIGFYLGFSEQDKKNKQAQLHTRNFIIDTFEVECKKLPLDKNLLAWETEMINSLGACLNSKKVTIDESAN